MAMPIWLMAMRRRQRHNKRGSQQIMPILIVRSAILAADVLVQINLKIIKGGEPI
jgi:hypothetical protein